METFSALLAPCAGIPRNFPHKGQWHEALMFSLICAWIKDWVNNREAGDLRRHRAHYDVIVMNSDKLESVLGEQSFGIMSQKVEWQGCSKMAFKQHLKTHIYSNPAQIKENIKAPHHWSLWGNSPVTGEFPTQRASNAEIVSIWWRHHGPFVSLTAGFLSQNASNSEFWCFVCR